ncbi:MAG: hypothetical protein L0Y54_12195 [Sporichthyaceae bacterium]|nr:hypothetical protein [Sporichthyaceae bacterium]
MHRLSRVLACAVTVAVLAACSSDDEPNGPTAGPTGAGSQSPPISTAIPSNGVTGNPTTEPTAFATEDRLIPPPDRQIKLEKVTTERDGSIERVIIEIEGNVTPGVETRYVDMVRIEDEPVLTDGNAALELVLESADPTGEQGLSPDVTTELLPGYPIVREVLYARYLAGTVLFAIGVSEQVPYRVLAEQTRVVIEFQG